MSVSNNTSVISPVDALWSLFLNQPKAIRKELSKRMKELNDSEREARKLKEYEATLSPETVAKAHEIAQTIIEGVREVEKARAEGKPFGRPARDLLLELENDSAETL